MNLKLKLYNYEIKFKKIKFKKLKKSKKDEFN